MIVVSHPTGNANVRAVLAALDGAGLLAAFHTTVGVNGSAPWLDWLPTKLAHGLKRRGYSLSPGKLYRHPRLEACRLIGRATIDQVCFDLDSRVAAWCRRQRHLDAVYAYEDVARDTFRAARDRGWRTIYDLPIAYWETSQRLLREEAERRPEWEPTLVGTRDSQEKLARKTEELSLADLVICPSRFVLQSLPVEARSRAVVAEFGSPFVDSDARAVRDNASALRVLFAGSLTQRKGLADVFDAIRLLRRSDVELVVMGTPIVPLEFYRSQLSSFTYEPPRPHDQVLALMRSCDVLVLPSLVEGRALVQQEAMACGLPLIATPNGGGEDLIEEGRTGFLVPIRSPEAIAEKIAWLADNRRALPEMSRAALGKAREYTWRAYGEKVVGAVREALSPQEVAA